MGKGRYFRPGAGLVMAGAVFITLDLWLLSTLHWAPGIRGGNAGLAVAGKIMLTSGAMVLRAVSPNRASANACIVSA